MGIPADILIWEFSHRDFKCLTGSGPVKERGSDRVTGWKLFPDYNLENDISKLNVERRIYNYSWVGAYISIIFLSGPHTTELTTSFSKRWNCPVCSSHSARWYFILQNNIKNMCYKWETLSFKKEQSLADEIVSDWSISTWLYTSTISTSQITQ